MFFYLSMIKDENTLFYNQSRGSVRNILSSNYVEFRKSQFSTNTADNFKELMINCFYDDNDLLQEIEIFEPNVVCILENNFIGKTVDEISNYLSKLEIKYAIDSMGVFIDDLGIGTVSNNSGITECVYLDLEKSSYLNVSDMDKQGCS